MKKVLFLTTALIMSAMMWAAEKTLTFNLTSNPGGWPTSNSTTPTDYTYTLDDVDYTFVLKNVKCNSGYLMMTQPASLGLPAIEGYKLTKVVAKNSKDCSTAVNVGISYSSESADYISGGAAQTWSTKSSSYTYELNETSDNVVYYLYVTKKNAQVTELELTYTSGDTPQRTLESIYIAGEAENLEYFVGEEFDHAGLKVMGVYDDELGDAEITSGITWSYNPEVFALGNTFVDVLAQYKDFTSEVFTVNNIVVTEKPAPVGGAIIIDPATQAAITTAADINVTIEDINVAYNGTLLTTDPAQFRVYANKTLTLTANASIKQVRIIGYVKADFTLSVDKGVVTTGASYATATTKATWEDPLIVVENINATSVVLSPTKQMQAYKIEVTLSQTPTAMPEVMENANVSKQLINGQLIIIRDNVRYNVAGQQL